MDETQNKKKDCITENYIRNRPLWQRIIYPIVGGILIVLGITLWLLPVLPGFFLVIVGLPLLFCFHPRFEALVRRIMHNIGSYLKKKIRKRRERHQQKNNE